MIYKRVILLSIMLFFAILIKQASAANLNLLLVEEDKLDKHINKAVQIAVDEKNLKGGNNYKLIIIHGSSVNKTDLKKLIDTQKIYGGISTTLSHKAKNIVKIAEENKLVLILPTASHGILTENNDYIFRNTLTDPLQAAAMAKYAVEELKYKSSGIFFENSVYSSALANYFSSYFSKIGGKVVFKEKLDKLDKKAIEATFEKAKKNKIDLLYMPCIPVNFNKVIAIGQKLGLNKKYFGSDALFSKGVFKLPKKQLPNIYFSNASVTHPLSKEYNSFANIFKQAAGKNPSFFDINAYDSTKILISSIENVYSEASDSDKKELKLSGEKIKDYIYKTEFKGLLDPIIFYKSGDAAKSVAICQIDIKSKKFKQVHKIKFDKSSEIFIKSSKEDE